MPLRSTWRIAVSFACLVIAVPALGVVIDDFKSGASRTAPRAVSHRRIGTMSATDPKLPGVIGGVRRVTVTVTSLQIPDLDTVTADILPGVGVFDYSSTNGADGRVDLTYDGGDARGAGLNLNLSAESAILVDIAEADTSAVPYTVSVKLADGSGRSAETTQNIVSPGPRQLRFPLAAFKSITLTRVRSIALGINPGRAGVLQLNQVRTVAAGGKGS